MSLQRPGLSLLNQSAHEVSVNIAADALSKQGRKALCPGPPCHEAPISCRASALRGGSRQSQSPDLCGLWPSSLRASAVEGAWASSHRDGRAPPPAHGASEPTSRPLWPRRRGGAASAEQPRDCTSGLARQHQCTRGTRRGVRTSTAVGKHASSRSPAPARATRRRPNPSPSPPRQRRGATTPGASAATTCNGATAGPPSSRNAPHKASRRRGV
mmetsp:Transcript_20960/g.42357  ORF Transcript_20960/g.42357 Transcript_20960/m.42357 type:complete len:214 (-) Transcript_20960:209-850(-)